MFEVIFKVLPGFLSTLVANFLPTQAEILPTFLQKLHSSSSCIILSLTVKDFFLLPNEQYPVSTLLILQVMSPHMLFVADLCLSPTQ